MPSSRPVWLVSGRRQNPDALARGAGPTVEVAHEALLRRWAPLAAAIMAGRVDLVLRSDLERLTADWVQGGRDEAYLLLAGCGSWSSAPGSMATLSRASSGEPEREFVGAGRALAARELAKSRRSTTRLRSLGVGLALLLVLATTAAVIAVHQTGSARDQQRRAEDGQRLATSRLLTTRARSALDRDPRAALQLGEIAYRIHPDDETRTALTSVALSTPYLGSLDQPEHDDRGASSPTAPIMATAGVDGAVVLWDVSTPVAPRQMGRAIPERSRRDLLGGVHTERTGACDRRG